MKEYFKRLKDHAGIGPATIMTIMIFLAASGNKNLDGWGVLIMGGIASGIIWSIVLISNRK